MKSVWKYTFDVMDQIILHMPAGAKVLSVQTQGNNPCIWCLVDPSADKVPRKFLITGTGYAYPSHELDSADYVGTFQMSGGVLVFHLFEVKE